MFWSCQQERLKAFKSFLLNLKEKSERAPFIYLLELNTFETY